MKLPLAEMEKILGGAGVWEEIGISVGHVECDLQMELFTRQRLDIRDWRADESSGSHQHTGGI